MTPTRVLVIDGKGVRIPPGRYDRIVVKPGSEILPSEPGDAPVECGEFVVMEDTPENPTRIGRDKSLVYVKADKLTILREHPKRRARRRRPPRR